MGFDNFARKYLFPIIIYPVSLFASWLFLLLIFVLLNNLALKYYWTSVPSLLISAIVIFVPVAHIMVNSRGDYLWKEKNILFKFFAVFILIPSLLITRLMILLFFALSQRLITNQIMQIITSSIYVLIDILFWTKLSVFIKRKEDELLILHEMKLQWIELAFFDLILFGILEILRFVNL